MVNIADIKNTLETCELPYLGPHWVTPTMLRNVSIENSVIHATVPFGFPVDTLKEKFAYLITTHLKKTLNIVDADIAVTTQIHARGANPARLAIPSVKNIIAIASGKGGVGKSTTTVNLALALSALGARVGILDADIYGPNQPHMLGDIEKPTLADNEHFSPMIRYGIQTMSMGYLVDAETPMVWRGPMVIKALQEILYHTVWDTVDYLLIDLPPGTGDVQLTLSQKVPVSGVVIVTTPQEIALLDARKALEMFRKVSVPILGIVENMSVYACVACGHHTPIFGEGGAATMAEKYGISLLGQLPLSMDIRQYADCGKPIVAAEPRSDVAQLYRDIALHMTAQLSREKINYGSLFSVSVQQFPANV